MAGDTTSKSGVWVDSQTGKIVESEPVEGYQIVPKGGEITPDIERQIDLLKNPPKKSPTPTDLSVGGDPALTVTSTPPRPAKK